MRTYNIEGFHLITEKKIDDTFSIFSIKLKDGNFFCRPFKDEDRAVAFESFKNEIKDMG